MSELEAYLYLGLTHITDLNGYDHILFIVGLCVVYQLKDWKKILVLVTAFTLGHSLTLALATLNIIALNSKFVEVFIPITIILTSTYNFWTQGELNAKTQGTRYAFAAFFGLIHGLGFSNFLRSMLSRKQSLFDPLLAFNIGLEIGQLAIVVIFFTLQYLMVNLLRLKQNHWFTAINGMVIVLAVQILFKNIVV